MRPVRERRHAAPSPPSANSFLGVTSWTRPTFTIGRLRPFADQATLTLLIQTIQAGDYIRYSASNSQFVVPTTVLTISSSSTFPYSLVGVNPTATAVIDFGTAKSVWNPVGVSSGYVRFDYTGTGGFNSMKIANCSNLQFFGGELKASNAGSGGIGVWATSHDILWWDAYVNHIGGSGISILPTTTSGAAGTMYNIDIRAEVNRFCLNPSFDPHTDKGAGIQGCILHGASAGGDFHDSRFTIYAHDPLAPGEVVNGVTYPEGGGGSAIEHGHSPNGTINNITLYGLAENMLMRPGNNGGALNPGSAVASETGGNCFNLFGSIPLNGTIIGWAEANNCSGGVTHCANGSWGTSASPPVTVQHGRHNNCNQYYAPAYSSNRNVPYDPNTGSVVYQDYL